MSKYSLQNFCQENTDKYYLMESKENGYIFCAVELGKIFGPQNVCPSFNILIKKVKNYIVS